MRARLRVADDRRGPHKGPPARRRGKGRQPGHRPYKRGPCSKVRLAVDAHGMPVRVIVTAGNVADCVKAPELIEGIEAGFLMADKGYDSNEIVGLAIASGMQPVIPPRRNRKEQREYDKYLYRLRHLVENAFMHLKQWRGIATRYAKSSASYLAAVHIRCIAWWAKIY